MMSVGMYKITDVLMDLGHLPNSIPGGSNHGWES